jgi:hypothetical protein
MLLEKIMFESGKTLYFRLRLEDLPMKIKKSMPEYRSQPNTAAWTYGKFFNIFLR